MVLGLARRLLWAYPVSMALLAGFVGYETERVLRTSNSLTLLALSGLDSVMIWLVWREYLALQGAATGLAAAGRAARALTPVAAAARPPASVPPVPDRSRRCLRPVSNPRLLATDAPAVMEAWRWLEGVAFPPDRPLMVFSAGRPGACRRPSRCGRRWPRSCSATRRRISTAPTLACRRCARNWPPRPRGIYGGAISADQVAITAGANQAFTAALTTLAGDGDEVLLPTPWYFNHYDALPDDGRPRGAAALRRRNAARPRRRRRADHARDPRDRAGHPQQPRRRRISRRT